MDPQGKLAQAIVNLREAEVRALVKEKRDAGVPAMEILAECRAAMSEVGARFDRGESFIPELMFAGTIMRDVLSELGPKLKESAAAAEKTTTVVIGTVRGDIHDIGKDVVVMVLQGTGFNIVDLGVDVPAERFVEAIKENNASVVGMSVFLTACCKSISETVEAIKAAALRDKVSIMIGGAAASDMVSERTGCDYYGETAVDALNHTTKVAASLSGN